MATVKETVLLQFRQLDKGGLGLIDQASLCTLFKRLDASIWTDDNLAVLLDAAGGGGKDQIRVEDFVEWVFGDDAAKRGSVASHEPTPRSLTSTRSPTRLRTADVHSASLDTYMEELVRSIKGFRDVMHPEDLAGNGAATAADVEALRAELKERARDCMREAQSKNIRPIWDEFAGSSTALSPQECRHLISAYFKALKPKSEEMVRGSIEFGMELSVLLFEWRVEDQRAREKMRAHAKRQVEVIFDAVAPRVRETLEAMEKEDPGAIAEELLECLDLNHDGKVTRDDFERGFVDCMHQVLGPERMMEHLPRVNAVA